MQTPQPLSALKQLPVTPSSSPLLKTSFKRPSDPLGENRLPGTVTFKKPRLADFNEGSESPYIARQHVPRALTPSTSTVACSSSPPRILSSSPSRHVESRHRSHGKRSDVKTQSARLEIGTPLIFGRHRHRPAEGSVAPGSAQTAPRLAVPKHLHHLVPSLDAPATTVYLPRNASHVSRVHALVEYVASTDSARLLVIGQNGLKLNGRRVLSGQIVEVPRSEALMLDFYGAKVDLSFPQPEQYEQEQEQEMEMEQDMLARGGRLFTPSLSSPPLSPLSPLSENGRPHVLSLPPSSPPVASMEFESDEYSERESSPFAPEHEHDHDHDHVQAQERQVKAEMLEAEPRAPSVSASAPASSPAPIAGAPEGVDLPALLASTVVFSGSSKLSLPDLVKHMLDVSILLSRCYACSELISVTAEPQVPRRRSRMECMVCTDTRAHANVR